LAEAIRRFDPKTEDVQEKLGEMLSMVYPIIEVVCCRHPLYLREDLKQELGIFFMNRVPIIHENVVANRVNGNILNYVRGAFENAANTWVKRQGKIECRYVRIDDVKIEPLVYPKTYEKSKIIHKIRKALEAFYRRRFPARKYRNRASRFAYTILDGKRPNFNTNNLARFFNGNIVHARQAYTVSLIIIRRILENHRDEVLSILED
jgi:hypothetical protein